MNTDLRFADPTATGSIVEAVSEQLRMPHLQGLTSVVMVGGFSGSVHVQVRTYVQFSLVQFSLKLSYKRSTVILCAREWPTYLRAEVVDPYFSRLHVSQTPC